MGPVNTSPHIPECFTGGSAVSVSLRGVDATYHLSRRSPSSIPVAGGEVRKPPATAPPHAFTLRRNLLVCLLVRSGGYGAGIRRVPHGYVVNRRKKKPRSHLRNRGSHRIQNPVAARSCGFESHLRYCVNAVLAPLSLRRLLVRVFLVCLSAEHLAPGDRHTIRVGVTYSPRE